MNDIFDTNENLKYLQFRLEAPAKAKWGQKSEFAKSIGCDGAYVSRILEGKAHLSLEQAMRANRYFGHTPDESEFFLAQVGYARAGSQELRLHYKKQMDSLRNKHRTLSRRVDPAESFPEITQATYYSLWAYAAIDIATSIPSLQTADALSQYFHLSLESVTSILSFLRDCGVVEQKDGRWLNTNRQIYLSSDSPHIRKHHLNWRLKAMQMIEQPEARNLHYSSVVSMSVHDFERLKEHLIQAVTKARGIVKDSNDEMIAAYTIDCFELKG